MSTGSGTALRYTWWYWAHLNCRSWPKSVFGFDNHRMNTYQSAVPSRVCFLWRDCKHTLGVDLHKASMTSESDPYGVRCLYTFNQTLTVHSMSYLGPWSLPSERLGRLLLGKTKITYNWLYFLFPGAVPGAHRTPLYTERRLMNLQLRMSLLCVSLLT